MATPKVNLPAKNQLVKQPESCTKSQLKSKPITCQDVSEFLNEVYQQVCRYKPTKISRILYYEVGGTYTETHTLDVLSCGPKKNKEQPKKSSPSFTVYFQKKEEVYAGTENDFDVTCRYISKGALRCYGPRNSFAFSFERKCGVLYLVDGHNVAYEKDMTPQEKGLNRLFYHTNNKKVEQWWTPASW